MSDQIYTSGEPASKEPTTIIIFGATGDLAKRKLIPALFHLFASGFLPENVSIVGLAKEEKSLKDFQEFATQAIAAKHAHRQAKLDEFLELLHYEAGDFADHATYQTVAEHLQAADQEKFSGCSNKMFYLAVPPVVYDSIFENLAKSGLATSCTDSKHPNWTRVLVEKPFGRDLKTAQELDDKLGNLFQEDQIFRIDHYLAKETVQNIITFRFGNAMFEPIWNKESVDSIHIMQWETIGVGERASFYEGVGALRDVGQNHLLQMLALIMMEDPGSLDPHAIRSARSILLQNVGQISDLENNVVRGQYTGYQDRDDVDDETETETFFRLKTSVNNKRWQGVPVTLEAGKKMSENKVEIVVTFKEPMSCVCPEDDQLHKNELTIRIQPDEGISLKFWVKKPGLGYELEPRTLSFSYNDNEDDAVLPDAYEKVLYDCIRGDLTLFASTDEVAAAWRFITPILENWSVIELQNYEPGSTGPA